MCVRVTDGQVSVMIGLRAALTGDEASRIPLEVADEIEAARAAGCACAALTAWHIAGLIDDGAFVTAAVRVVAGKELTWPPGTATTPGPRRLPGRNPPTAHGAGLASLRSSGAGQGPPPR